MWEARPIIEDVNERRMKERKLPHRSRADMWQQSIHAVVTTDIGQHGERMEGDCETRKKALGRAKRWAE